MPTVREVLLRMDEAVPGASDDDVRKAFLQEYGVDLNGVGEEQLDIEIESLPQDPLPSAPLPPIGPPPDDDKSALWRAGLHGLSKVARGAALESPLALSRAIGFEEAQVPHGMTFEEAVESPDVEISPSVALNERWKQWEQEVYEPSTSIDDVLENPNPTNLINFIGEGMVGSIPGMAYAIYNMPSFAWSLVGDIATTRAANEGRAVTPQDFLVAVGTATTVAGLERTGAKAAGLLKGQPGILGKAVATRGTRLGRTGAAGAAEAGTEAIQEYVQAAGEQAFTETGMDQTEAAKRMLGGALIGGPTGAMFRGGREVQLAAAERAGILPEAVYEAELAARAEGATPSPMEERWGEGVHFTEGARRGRKVEVAEKLGVDLNKIRRKGRGPDGEEGAWIVDGRDLHGAINDAFKARGWPLDGSITEADIDSLLAAEAEEATAAPVDQKQPDKAKGFRELYERRTEPHPANPLYRVWDGGQTAVFDEFEHDPDVSDIHLEQITAFTDRRGEGVGSRILQEITKMADESGATVSVEALSKGGPMSTSQLVDWYKRHGFKLHPEYGDEGLMVRAPKELAPSPVEEVVEAVIEEPPGKPGTVPGEYTDIASSLEEEAVDVQLETKSAVEAIEKLEEAVKTADTPTPPAAPRAAERPTEVKPRRKYRPPDYMKEAIQLLRKHADPETVEEDLFKAALHVLGRKKRKDADLDDDSYFAAQKRHLDPYIDTIAQRMGMTEGDVAALKDHEVMSYADIMRSVDEAGLSPSLGPEGVEIPSSLQALITKTNATGYAPTATEEAAMHWTLMLQRKRRADILDNADPSAPDTRVTLEKLDQDALQTAMALRRAGTELGRAMRYRQFLVSPAMDLIQAQAEATILSDGKLDAKTKARLQDLWKNAEDIEAEGKRLKKKALANLEVAKKRLADAEAIAAGTMDVKRSAKAEARKRAAKDVAAEAESVVEAPVETAATVDLDAPIRVTPLRKSKEQRRMEKELRDAEKDVAAAKGEAAEADALMRKAERDKAGAAKEATKGRLLSMYDKAFGRALALKASGDLSAFGRQALPLVINNPLLLADVVPEIVKIAPWRKDARAAAREIQTNIIGEDFQALRDLAGLELTEVENLTNINGSAMETKEEAYMFRAFETGLLSNIVVPSQNAFGLTLNLLRSKNFDAVARQMAEAHGVDLGGMSNKEAAAAIAKAVPKQDLVAAGKLINVITGRGDWASGSGAAAETMRRLMFAPRFTLSRIETPTRLAQLYTKKGKFAGVSPEARSVLIKRINTNMGVYASLMMLTLFSAALNGDDWEEGMEALSDFFNPNEASFLKARIGDYHIDMFAGIPATIRHLLPMFFIPEALAPEGYSESWDEYLRGLGRLANAKAAPLVSGLRTLSAHDWVGREIKEVSAAPLVDMKPLSTKIWEADDFQDAALAAALLTVQAASDAFVPISVENVAKDFLFNATEEEKTVVQKAIPAVADFLGLGIKHYNPDDREKSKARSRIRKRATREFSRRRDPYR